VDEYNAIRKSVRPDVARTRVARPRDDVVMDVRGEGAALGLNAVAQKTIDSVARDLDRKRFLEKVGVWC